MKKNPMEKMGSGATYCGLRWMSFVVLSLLLATGCGSGYSNDGGPVSVDTRLADPGGPYEGIVGEPVQFDGSGSSDSENHSLTYEWSFGDDETSTLAMPTHTYSDSGTYTVTLTVCDASACSFNLNNDTTAVISAAANALAGGIWTGIDSDGEGVVAFVTETGRFHYIDEFLNQGAGILTVSNGNNVTGDFQLITELGFTFSDGTTLADCMLSGTIEERQALTVTVDCTTTAGLQDRTIVALNYEAIYERDSSLATVAGMFGDGSGAVTTIDADGTLFEQDSVSGCVVNGQVSVIDSRFNTYDFEFGIGNCVGQDAILNGSNFVGLGTLDNSVSPAVLIVAVIGDVAGELISIVFAIERL